MGRPRKSVQRVRTAPGRLAGQGEIAGAGADTPKMKRRRRRTFYSNSLSLCLCGWALVCGLLGAEAAARQQGARPLTEPHVMREDFQGDGLGQWASYPPAQDIGYEPSLSPTADYGAPGGRALMRVVKPNRTGALRFGFIKRVPTTMTGGARGSRGRRDTRWSTRRRGSSSRRGSCTTARG